MKGVLPARASAAVLHCDTHITSKTSQLLVKCLPLSSHMPGRYPSRNSLAHPPHLRCQTSNHDQAEPSTSQIGLQDGLHLLKQKSSRRNKGPGKVYLIGTGPGDPGLLTLRAYQLMQSADIVLYDRLVSDDILSLVGGSACMLYVGKQAGFHTRTQSEIHQLLLEFAEAGATVVRLKGGDPYVFGRGGEEMQYLRDHGISVQCVPGITAASGICAELGIPMTHRGVATSVRFLTGHARDGGEQQLDETIAASADQHTTLVVYMGLQMLPTLVSQLCGHGLNVDTPCVAVERGTTPDQRVVYATLEELPGTCKAAGLKSPTLIIIGKVVAVSAGWQHWESTGRPLVVDHTQQFPGQFTLPDFGQAPVPGEADALIGLPH